jgi:membrane protease YdiL (CAAX protease family)
VGSPPAAEVPGEPRRRLLARSWPAFLLLLLAAAILTLSAIGRERLLEPASAESGRAPVPAADAMGDPLVGLAGLALVLLGTVVLLLMLEKRPREWLLPPPRLAPRTLWDLEHLACGLLLTLSFAVLAAQVGKLFLRGSAIAGTALTLGSQLASAAAVVALVVTRPRVLSFGARPAESGGVPASVREALRSLGLSRRAPGRNVLRGLALGLAGLAAAYSAALLASLLSELVGVRAPVHPVIRRAGSAGPAETALLVFAACVAAPLFEELLFRGFLYATLRDWLGAPPGVLVSAGIFAAAHPGAANQAATFVLGFVLVAAYERGGTLVAPLVAHATFNALQMTLVLLGRILS